MHLGRVGISDIAVEGLSIAGGVPNPGLEIHSDGRLLHKTGIIVLLSRILPSTNCLLVSLLSCIPLVLLFFFTL